MEAANNPRAISPFHPLVFQWRAADSSSSDYCKHSWGGNGRCTREEELRIGSILFFFHIPFSSLILYPSTRWRGIVSLSFEGTILLRWVFVVLMISFSR